MPSRAETIPPTPFAVRCSTSMAGTPRYTVVRHCQTDALAREAGSVVGRSFSLGVRSLLFTVPEALRLILKYKAGVGYRR